MEYGFWKNLPRPFFVLAPMYDVTDVAFRQVITRRGKPDVFFTEFVSTDGLQSVGKSRLMHHLAFEPEQQPIVAQVFGAKPENFKRTAELVRSLGFSGMDINMGCPDKNIIKGGSCAALFRNPELAVALIAAAKAGAGNMPVSVKIRIGDTKIDWQPWIVALLQAQPATITIHLRTRKEMSKVPAHWELLPEIVQYIHANTTPETRPIIIGNGDVQNLVEARSKAAATQCDGVMLGRAIFGNPWLFSEHVPNQTEKLQALTEHIQLYEHYFAGIKLYDVLKRHFKSYIHGFEGAPELREQLYATKTCAEALTVLRTYENQ